MTFIYKNPFIHWYEEFLRQISALSSKEIETDYFYFRENIILIIALDLTINTCSIICISLCYSLFLVTWKSREDIWVRKEDR